MSRPRISFSYTVSNFLKVSIIVAVMLVGALSTTATAEADDYPGPLPSPVPVFPPPDNEPINGPIDTTNPTPPTVSPTSPALTAQQLQARAPARSTNVETNSAAVAAVTRPASATVATASFQPSAVGGSTTIPPTLVPLKSSVGSVTATVIPRPSNHTNAYAAAGVTAAAVLIAPGILFRNDISRILGRIKKFVFNIVQR